MFLIVKTRPRRNAQSGASLVEYAIILLIVAGLTIGAALFLGGALTGKLSQVGNGLSGSVAAVTGCPTGQVPHYDQDGTLNRCEKIDHSAPTTQPPSAPATATKPTCKPPKKPVWSDWSYDHGVWKDGGWICD